MKVKFLVGLKFASFSVLLASFGITAYSAFMSYLSGRTMVSSSILEYPESQNAPEFVICNKTGFKTIKKHLSVKDYVEDTLKLEDFFVSFKNEDLTELNYSIIPVNSIFRGRCYVFKLDSKMNGEVLQMKINTNQVLTINMIPPEERLMVVSGIYSHQPTFYELGKEEGVVDIEMKTVIKKREHNCKVYDKETDRTGKMSN